MLNNDRCSIVCNVNKTDTAYTISTQTKNFEEDAITDIDKQYKKLTGGLSEEEVLTHDMISLEVPEDSEGLTEVKEAIASTILGHITQAIINSLKIVKIEVKEHGLENELFFNNRDIEESPDILHFIQKSVAIKSNGAEIVGLNI